jgi:hypothetical protein
MGNSIAARGQIDQTKDNLSKDEDGDGDADELAGEG